MDKFGLFDFISKLSASPKAQSSLQTILSKLFATAPNPTNDGEKSSRTNKANGVKPNFSGDVYRSPEAYTLYSEMIEKHNKISKEIDKNLPKNS